MGETPSPASEKLQEYADNLSEISDELHEIEEHSSADEISFSIRDGQYFILELSYNFSNPNRSDAAAPLDVPRS